MEVQVVCAAFGEWGIYDQREYFSSRRTGILSYFNKGKHLAILYCGRCRSAFPRGRRPELAEPVKVRGWWAGEIVREKVMIKEKKFQGAMELGDQYDLESRRQYAI